MVRSARTAISSAIEVFYGGFIDTDPLRFRNETGLRKFNRPDLNLLLFRNFNPFLTRVIKTSEEPKTLWMSACYNRITK